MTGASTWWGTYRVPPGRVDRWRIGPTTIVLQRLAHEWRIGYDCADEPLANLLEVERDVGVEAMEGLQARRFAAAAAATELTLSPALADRSIVTRTEDPFCVPAGHRCTLYVSTPLWVRLEAGDTGALLDERPLFRPSDTWFGPNPREGELCYASRSLGRLELGDLPNLPHRCRTAVHLDNRSSRPLWLERIKLPVTLLSIYEHGGALWTQEVAFEHEDGADLAPLKLRDVPPSQLPGARRLAGPRVEGGERLLTRAFFDLLSRMA